MLNARTLLDLNLQVTTALPAAGATANSASLDTLGDNPGRIPDVEVSITVPATPSLADTKNLVLTLQDSADNATFAAVADAPVITATGAGGLGAAAISRQIKIPITTRRYIRLSAAVDAAGGNSTAISSVFGLVF